MIDSRKDMGKRQARVLLVAYMLFFAFYTVFTRSSGPRRWNLIPFWEIRYALSGGMNTFHYIIINILLCIPMGYFAACAFENAKKWKILLIVTCFSITIELAQLITGGGLCEFDDVFNNTLGGAIGMLCYFGPLHFYDAASVTVVYGAVMAIQTYLNYGDFNFWRVSDVLLHTYILYIPAHAIISVFIYRLFGMYDDMRGRRGWRAAVMIIMANAASLLSKFLIQYCFAYRFSVGMIYYTAGFILQSFLTMYIRRRALVSRAPERMNGDTL